jgi:hypothetical protein
MSTRSHSQQLSDALVEIGTTRVLPLSPRMRCDSNPAGKRAGKPDALFMAG